MSPSVSHCLPLSATRLSLLPNPHPQAEERALAVVEQLKELTAARSALEARLSEANREKESEVRRTKTEAQKRVSQLAEAAAADRAEAARRHTAEEEARLELEVQGREAQRKLREESEAAVAKAVASAEAAADEQTKEEARASLEQLREQMAAQHTAQLADIEQRMEARLHGEESERRLKEVQVATLEREAATLRESLSTVSAQYDDAALRADEAEVARRDAVARSSGLEREAGDLQVAAEAAKVRAVRMKEALHEEQSERRRLHNTVEDLKGKIRFVVGEYAATTSYCFLLLLASPARAQTL